MFIGFVFGDLFLFSFYFGIISCFVLRQQAQGFINRRRDKDFLIQFVTVSLSYGKRDRRVFA